MAPVYSNRIDMRIEIRIKKHEAVPKCGSFEVRFSDGRPSEYFYWDDELSRRLQPEKVGQGAALKQAQEFARRARGSLK
jgi:hypothetical protein